MDVGLFKWQLKVVEELQAMRNNGKSLSQILSVAGGNKTSISDAINGNYEKVGEGMWKTWKANLGIHDAWEIFPTSNYKRLLAALEGAYKHKRVVGISTYTGAGKTETCRWAARNMKGVYYVMCDGDMTPRDLLLEIQEQMSISVGGTKSRRSRAIAAKLRSEGSMLILDEFSSVRRQLYHTVGTIIKQVEHYASIVLVGTEYLKEDFEYCAHTGRRGMGEVERRFKKNWVQLPDYNIKDVAMIAVGNGIKDKRRIRELYNQTRNFGELRDMIRD